MKIAINTIPLLSPLTGAGHYTYQIAKALREIDLTHHYTYFYGYYSQRLTSPEETPQTFYRVKEAIRKTPVLGSAARNFQGFLNFFSTRKFDLYFEPHFIPLNILAGRTVVTILDFSFFRFPEFHTKDKVRYFKNHFWKKIERADHIITLSNFIKDEAVELFRFPRGQITAIHLGFDPKIFKIYEQKELKAFKNQYNLPEGFILFVGSIEPRKNLINLLRAYLALQSSIRRDFKLVLVGTKGWENKEVIAMLEKLKSDVIYVGYIPEKDLGKIYNLARLFVYPSFYEGFGLPPLEAMACGCPAIVSQTASLPEVCGDAVFYINPYDVEEITAGMERVLIDSSLRDLLKTKGFERAARFSWEKAAQEHLKVFEAIFSS